MEQNQNQEFQYEIVEHIATLYTNPKNGWTKELNRVSFNGNAPKFDIRDWSPEHDKMGKGVSLTNGEAKMLKEAFANINL